MDQQTKGYAMTPDQIAARFGCTPEQLKAQYRANLEQTRALLAKALASGEKQRGFTADQLAANVAKLEKLAS